MPTCVKYPDPLDLGRDVCHQGAGVACLACADLDLVDTVANQQAATMAIAMPIAHSVITRIRAH